MIISMNSLYRYILFSFFLLALVSCQPAGALPTRVPELTKPEEVTVVEQVMGVTAVSVNIPGTFTPAPNSTIDPSLNFGDNSPLGPTLTPSITPILPTSTQFVPLGPATRTRVATRTPTPLPTPTDSVPIVPFPNPDLTSDYPIIRGSKLSIHVIRNNDKGIMDFVRWAQPSTIKVVDDLGFTTDIKEASPNTIVVGRVNQLDQNYGGSPEVAARAYVQRHLRKYLLNSGVDYWEGWNEADPNV